MCELLTLPESASCLPISGISYCKCRRYVFTCPRTLFKYTTLNSFCGIGISNKSLDRPSPAWSSSYPSHRAVKHWIIFSCTSPAFPTLGNVILFSPSPFNVSSIRSLVDGGQLWPTLARQMNERDQEAFLAWRLLADVLLLEFPLSLELRLCLEDPGCLYPNIRPSTFWNRRSAIRYRTVWASTPSRYRVIVVWWGLSRMCVGCAPWRAGWWSRSAVNSYTSNKICCFN